MTHTRTRGQSLCAIDNLRRLRRNIVEFDAVQAFCTNSTKPLYW